MAAAGTVYVCRCTGDLTTWGMVTREQIWMLDSFHNPKHHSSAQRCARHQQADEERHGPPPPLPAPTRKASRCLAVNVLVWSGSRLQGERSSCAKHLHWDQDGTTLEKKSAQKKVSHAKGHAEEEQKVLNPDVGQHS